jgi:hypothetical protein
MMGFGGGAGPLIRPTSIPIAYSVSMNASPPAHCGGIVL